MRLITDIDVYYKGKYDSRYDKGKLISEKDGSNYFIPDKGGWEIWNVSLQYIYIDDKSTTKE